MRIVILTSNGLRHKFLANSLSLHVDDTLIISECKPTDSISDDSQVHTDIENHFLLRNETEKTFFPNNDYFISKTLPIMYKEANFDYVYQVVKNFKPDLIIVFGSSIIRDPLLSLLSAGNFINLHLGISPYYLGSGTNFWPFVNNELEYLGSTILHLDSGIDTGDIICHVRPIIDIDDNVHTIGCKIIQESVVSLIKILTLVKEGKKLNRIKQWNVKERYYKIKDFDNDALSKYNLNLKNNIIDNYLKKDKKYIKLVDL
jgi:phosphoribosylglycinamide formyltransferase 1